MFLLIPFTLMLASVVGISVIIYRKMPYLKKLTPETHLSAQSGGRGNILTDLFPELSDGFEKLKLREYRDIWFTEVEKFLRRLRVASLKMDRISESWIKRIRKGNSVRMAAPVIVDKVGVVAESPVIKAQPVQRMTTEDMKREEQRLIIEIAKNPKDVRLYEVLGDLYIKMNNFADAKESFEAALELNPHNEELGKKRSQVAEKMLISQELPA